VKPRPPSPGPSAARHSAAWIDALVCPIRVDRARLAASLPRIEGLSLAPLRGQRARSHPVVIEIWRVRDGRVEAAGVDVHGWSQLVGGAAGLAAGGASGGAVGATFGGLVGAAGGGVMGLPFGPAGLLLGALAGSMAGLSTGAALGAAGAAAYGAGLASSASRRVSETGSRLLGTYGEVLVTTPCLLATAGGALPVAFVLAMYTDSRVSRWGEAALGFGFGKRAARLQIDGARMEVQTAAGATLLRVSLRGGRQPQPLSASAPAAAKLRARAAMPLLGQRSGRAVLSGLERHFDDRAVRLWPASGRLEVAADFAPGMAASGHALERLGARSSRGTYAVTDLPVHLTYPRPLRRTPKR
jgi:hypothetical protein